MGDSIFKSESAARLFLALHAVLMLFALSVAAMRLVGVGKGLELVAFVIAVPAVVGLKYFPTKRGATWTESWAASMSAWGLDPRHAPWAAGAFFGAWLFLTLAGWGLAR